MKALLLIPSMVKTDVAEATAAGRHPQMDYWALFEGWERRFGSGTVEILDYAAVERSTDPRIVGLRKTAGKDVALAALGRQKADLVETIFTNGENVGIPLAMMLRGMARRPGHVMIGHRLSTGKKRLFFARLKVHAQMDTIFLYAETQRKFAMENLRIEPERLQLIAFHADTRFFRSDAPGVGELVEPVSGDLISAAGLEWRDYPTLITAVKDMTDLTVRLAAASPWSKHVNETDKVAMPAHVNARRYSYGELRDLYFHSQIVAVPLYENDFQAGVTTLLEAMAMGKPVIVTRTSGQTDVVIDGENGIYVPPGDVDAWKKAIERLRDDAALRERLGRNARVWMEKNASLTLWAEKLVSAMEAAGQKALAHRSPSLRASGTDSIV